MSIADRLNPGKQGSPEVNMCWRCCDKPARQSIGLDLCQNCYEQLREEGN